MGAYKNILETIGNTPMVTINKLNSNKDIQLLAKLEMFNPGGSIKDRMAVHIINQAEKQGQLKPRGTIVEATSGNTGIGVALVGLVKGYNTIIVTSEKTSEEKINLLKAYKAKVVIAPADVPSDSEKGCIGTAKRIAAQTSNCFYVNQYDNPENSQAHYLTTGPEIWTQTKGKIDYFVTGIGTGGTISGVAKYLKEKDCNIKVIAVDPAGSVFYNYFKNKKLIKSRAYKIEGIGGDMIPKVLNFDLIDDIVQVSDHQAFKMVIKILKQEGIFAGLSSGAAMWASLNLIKKLKGCKRVVTIFPDQGLRYISKLFK